MAQFVKNYGEKARGIVARLFTEKNVKVPLSVFPNVDVPSESQAGLESVCIYFPIHPEIVLFGVICLLKRYRDISVSSFRNFLKGEYRVTGPNFQGLGNQPADLSRLVVVPPILAIETWLTI